MDKMIVLAPIVGALALVFALITAKAVSKESAGNEKMREIASAIAEGAKAFLTSEYKIMAVVIALKDQLIVNPIAKFLSKLFLNPKK